VVKTRNLPEPEKSYPSQPYCPSALARHLLAIPASSAASERVFSEAGCTRTVMARRTALASETVDNILFVHSNSNKLSSFLCCLVKGYFFS